MKARLIEIFASVQGEGLWVGKPQVFIRFHGCKLKCDYCDTPLTHHQIKSCRIEYPPFSKQFTVRDLECDLIQLDAEIARFGIKSLALTGGEPLEQADFIRHWLSKTTENYEVLLETSGIESENLGKILKYLSIISMDIKIPSATHEKPYWKEHDVFLRTAAQTPAYLKIVYDENISDDEINKIYEILNAHPQIMAAIFQPLSPIQKRDVKKCLEIYWRFASQFPQKVRLIPQMHKFLNVL
ncbi:MAG: radical SAM protein [uncultured bacterium]|nr:MAG: radical SAM protein [uncultured bacterium]